MTVEIISLSNVESAHMEHGKSYAWKRQKITEGSKAEKLGASVYEIPPGKKAFLYHFHHANEELFYILSGRGIVRVPEGEKEIKPGDFILAPPGKDGAHQLMNSSQEPLKYIAISTMIAPEVVEYPDSEKIFVMSEEAPGGEKSQRTISSIFRKSDTTTYWDGEPE